MKLTKITIENFRCYQIPFEVKIYDFNAIVGRNDIGKSAILDALAIFFEQEKMDQSDASVDGEKDNVKITCEFSDLPDGLIIDTDNSTNLRDEFLLNDAGRLEIAKTYNGSAVSPKAREIHACALHPSEDGYSDLHTLKRAELVRRAGELTVDLEGVNKTVNAELRQAIWASRADPVEALTSVDLQKETGKQVWSAIQKYLPTYWLFRSDRASTDQDSEAQDPLNAAIAEAIKAVEADLILITTRVEREVKKIADLTVTKLAEMDSNLSDSLNPVIKTKKWEALFNTSITGENGIPLNKRGSGVRRLILLSFFRAQVEENATSENNTSVIYAIEEPETSQHPRNQRLLLSTLQRLTSDPSRQVLITTHTPVLARAVPENNLRFIHANGVHRALATGGGDLNADIAKSLGVLPDHNVKVFIGVEGPNDIELLYSLSKILFEGNNALPHLERLVVEGQIIFVPLGGSCLALWADRLQPINRPEIHICDRDIAPPDPAKYQNHVDEINARDGCIAFNTTKRDMENYIHPLAIVEAYQSNGTEIELPDVFEDFDDVPIIVAQALNRANGAVEWEELEIEKQKQKEGKAKRMINGQAAKNMTVARLAEVDPDGEVTGWISEIQRLIDADI